MDESQPDWLQEPMQGHITNYSDLAENVLIFSVAEKQARVEAAEALVKNAIEKLKIADACVLSAESEVLAA